MGKVYFLFGIHNHQPVGNFPHIFKMAYEKCYRPFLDVLSRYPSVKCNLHISGPLYDWIQDNVGEFIDLVKDMLDKEQLEIIGGGYYEPILPIISEADRLGQIRLMSSFIKKVFKKYPQGLWLPERVWEPALAKTLNIAGINFTFLDDTHFRYAGLSKSEFFGYYITENQGYTLKVFPISKTLRYKIPFSEAHQALDLIKGWKRSDEDVLVTLFDDGEKFGLWPGTYDWVYKQKWLESFFQLLQDNLDSVETVLASDVLDKKFFQGICYLPSASYEEMGEWVLSPEGFSRYEEMKNFLVTNSKYEKYKNFIRGGIFENFYNKYARLNYMHKRMLYVSRYVHQHKDREVLDYLWKGQCNCSYWHGIFGGFYLGHIRDSVYENIIKAESIFDQRYSRKQLDIIEEDIDFDEYNEIILKNDKLILVFSSRDGSLLEFGVRERGVNLVNTITRREESYHSKIMENVQVEGEGVSTIHDIVKHKETGLENYLIYDKNEKVCFVDHLLEPSISADDFYRGNKTFPLKCVSNYSLKRRKSVINVDFLYEHSGLKYHKEISFTNKNIFKVKYSFSHTDILDNYLFGIEHNIFLLSPEKSYLEFNNKHLDVQEQHTLINVDEVILNDVLRNTILKFEFSPSDVFSVPIYSVSSSEEGFEKSFQQVSLLVIPRELNESFQIKVILK